MIRVVLSGVESTGKSTLAHTLAMRLGAVLVPEYGRTFTEALGRPLTLTDHHAIADGHARLADAAAAQNPAFMVEDTDIVMTSAWVTMLFGGRDSRLSARESRADLHLLLLPDVPFVPDPVRMFGTADARAAFHGVVVAEFAARGLSFVAVGGDWAAREARAIAAAGAVLP